MGVGVGALVGVGAAAASTAVGVSGGADGGVTVGGGSALVVAPVVGTGRDAACPESAEQAPTANSAATANATRVPGFPN